MARTLRIKVVGDAVTGKIEGKGERGILLAHGAGTSQDHPVMVATRSGLAAGGARVMTFNYPYSEAGRNRPDVTERLLVTHRAALAKLAERCPEGTYLAGRSMGGRMGTYLAAEGADVRGVVCYGYPLHPPGKPDRLRINHLGSIRVPMLFFQGDHDALSRSELFDRHVRSLPNAKVIDLKADHSLGGLGSVELLVRETLAFVLA
ncbi:MAG TPA: alpha/beta family hydrolase [Acidimicrobiia bacterium]|nr:alpha/beta family hydrolase [Acidimicrobiia bacterium]